MIDDPTSPSATVWAGLKLPVRQRLAAAVAHFLATGQICRADVMQIGEITVVQATTDLRTINERLPGLLAYDRRARRYVRPEAVLPPVAAREPAPAPFDIPPMLPQARLIVAFRSARIRLGLTQEQWGSRLGVGRRQINAYEKGEAPIPETIAWLAEALDGGFRPGRWAAEAAESEEASPAAAAAPRDS